MPAVARAKTSQPITRAYFIAWPVKSETRCAYRYRVVCSLCRIGIQYPVVLFARTFKINTHKVMFASGMGASVCAGARLCASRAFDVCIRARVAGRALEIQSLSAETYGATRSIPDP